MDWDGRNLSHQRAGSSSWRNRFREFSAHDLAGLPERGPNYLGIQPIVILSS
jgi:hypothetical protein